MRLAGPDAVLFVVGLVMLGGSGYGLYVNDAFGGGTSAFGAYTVTFAPAEETLSDVHSFETTGSENFEFTVPEGHWQMVTIVVSCQHAAGVPSQVSTAIDVTVTPPEGLNETTASGQCGSPIEVPVQVSAVPQGGIVEGSDSDDAAFQAEESQLSHAAVGNWTGSLTFTSSGGGALPVQIQFSGGVEAVLTKYVASATPVSTK